MSEANTEFLNEWFDCAPVDSPSYDAQILDKSQLRVVQATSDSRLVIEAGPGSGKTHVACERVISLVQNDDLAPARILILSFTRIAVAELRNRIQRRLDNTPNVASLQVRTFDSFAARLLAAVGLGNSGGHDATIQAATKLLRSNNPVVVDAMGQLEHVIIDEAQDLVGDREHMCGALLDLLAPTCGITVFGDFAQSIYGYQYRDKTGATFLTTVAKRSDFTSDQLEHDYRTRTAALKSMFGSIRKTLKADVVGSRDNYLLVREQIGTATIERDVTSFASHASTASGLILTRSRRGLYTAAEELRAAGRSYRVRLSDRPQRIEPWIGSLLGGLPATSRVSQDGFQFLYSEIRPAPQRDAADCWNILLDLDASGRGDISVGHVAEALADPPLDLVTDYEGRSGPLLSTIHAIKGREAEKVMLLLTRAPHGDTVDWAEEARTLYVGATRASSELRTGWINPRQFYTIGTPERYWAARRDSRLIEVGLEGDLADWTEFMRSGHMTSEAETISAIWQASLDGPQVAAYPDSNGRLIVRMGDREGTAIGVLSEQFIEIVQSLRQVEPGAPLPDVIGAISIVGATTVVVPARPGEAPSIAIMPLLGGFATIPR
ncbi:UvrD-helicase domain-containing protein [Aestuariivirga litoralis]|nr:UvrD-helicase domain-containing protein [Aestuariivirga litoralis]